jgi:hypothetical protein
MTDESQFDDQTKRELERINAALEAKARLQNFTDQFPLAAELIQDAEEALRPPAELHLDKEYSEMSPAQRQASFAERLRVMEQRDRDIAKNFFSDDALPNSPKRTMAMFIDDGQPLTRLDDTYYKENDISGE